MDASPRPTITDTRNTDVGPDPVEVPAQPTRERDDQAAPESATPVAAPPNPAWDYITTVPLDTTWSYEAPKPKSYEFPEDGRGVLAHRDKVTQEWTWAIPAPDTLDWITAYVNDDADLTGIVDWGAGNGYWAAQLAGRGLAVVAYDQAEVGSETSWYRDEDKSSAHVWYPVLAATEGVLTAPENRTRALFLCWPPYATPAAAQALLAFSGDTLIYIGESESGCTGDDRFFEILRREWEHVTDGPLTQWWALHDHLSVYRRL